MVQANLVGESSFNMTSWDEDIEGGSGNFSTSKPTGRMGEGAS